MSAGKVIFTYKRKRLSSCSGVGHANACSGFSSDVQTDKHQNASKKRSELPKNNLKIFNCINCDDADLSMNSKSSIEPYNHQHVDSSFEHVCQGETFSTACSLPEVHKSSMLKEGNHVQRSDTIDIRESILSSHDLAEDYTFKTSGTNIAAGVSLVKAINPSQREYCLDLNSSSPRKDDRLQGNVVSQSAEEGVDSVQKQIYQSNFKIAKAKLTTPLLTFSRRNKRKADAGGQDMNGDPSIRGETSAVEKRKSICVSSCSCEATPNKSWCVDGSMDSKAASGNAYARNVLRRGKEETIIKEIGDFPCSCARSCTDIVILKHTKEEGGSGEDLIMDTSAAAKQSVTKTSESSASPALNVEPTNFSRDNVECSSNIGFSISLVYDSCKTDDHPVSNDLGRASSGDSQLTSSDDSESKIVAREAAEQKASSASMECSYPPPGAFGIDCNVVPDSNLEEQVSDIFQDSLEKARTPGNPMLEVHLNGKSLELFEDTGIQAKDSHLVQSCKDACIPVKTESKPDNKWLQLFPDEGKSCPFSPAYANSEIDSKAEQNATFGLDSRKDWLELSSSKASAFLGLSTPSEPILGQTSKNGSGMQPSQDPYFKTREFIQNPVSLSFPDHASYIQRHKILVETINNNTTGPRGNRSISVDKFEPCSNSIMWSEEELDSLWIGVRRHGRGNWHAMLLDPRLRFSPWRTARDLADQWEREQYKLICRQHRPQQGRFSNPCNGGFTCPGTGIMRESTLAETRLSLGDVYSQNSHNHLRMGRFGLLNNLENSVFPDCAPAIGLAMNNHWHREAVGNFARTPVPEPVPVGAPRVGHPLAELSGTSCGLRNVAMAGDVLPPSGLYYGKHSVRKRVKTGNLIVIDSSEASSEETISDDHNVGR